MKYLIRFSILAFTCFLACSASLFAVTHTVCSSGCDYTSPCIAFSHIANGDTLTVDANSGPYTEDNCHIITANNTIQSINGRTQLFAPGSTNPSSQSCTDIWEQDGHDTLVIGFEFAFCLGGDSQSDGLRMASSFRTGGLPGSGTGGNLTCQYCYFHDNKTGLFGDLACFSGSNTATFCASPQNTYRWAVINPTFECDYCEFVNNTRAEGNTHNIYVNHGDNVTFILKYSYSHDLYNGGVYGHLVKCRAENCIIEYNQIGDAYGRASYEIDMPSGGNDTIIGNVIYQGTHVSGTNDGMILWREEVNSFTYDANPGQSFYFANNTVYSSAANNSFGQFVTLECINNSVSACPPPLTGNDPYGLNNTNTLFANNLFIGTPAQNTNDPALTQTTSILSTNAGIGALAFYDQPNWNFHLNAGSTAIGTGTAITGVNQAVFYYTQPFINSTRSTTTDIGAYSYIPGYVRPSLTTTTPASLQATLTGTITTTGLTSPTPPNLNYCVYDTGNFQYLPELITQWGSSTSIAQTFLTLPVPSPQTLTIKAFCQGGMSTNSVPITVGPPTLYSMTFCCTFSPGATVSLAGPATVGSGAITITVSSSNTTYGCINPTTYTIPVGNTSTSVGTATGTIFGSPGTESPLVTFTATDGTNTVHAGHQFFSPKVQSFSCVTCTWTSGTSRLFTFSLSIDGAACSTSLVTFSSDHPLIVPNQTISVSQGQTGPNPVSLTSNAVGVTTNVALTATYGNSSATIPTVVMLASGPPPVTISPVTISNATVSHGVKVQ